MFKRLSSGYKIASPGLVVALVCFFLPWVLQSCGTEPMRQYSGLQLALGSGGGGEGYQGNIFVLFSLAALMAILIFVFQSVRRGALTTRDTYGVLATSVLVLLLLFQQYLASPPKGVNREILYGLWGYLAGWLLILIGGAVNTLERHSGRRRR